MFHRFALTGVAVLALAVATPVAAQQQSSILLPGPQSISEADKASGAQADPQMTAEYGGAYTGPQRAMVSRVGITVARQSGITGVDKDFKFTLLNSAVPNAFAIPGGYVYCTRSLLALMNSEAELAFVLGHETGHIAAHHSDKRAKVAQRDTLLGAIGQTLLGAVLGNGAAGRIGGQLGQAGIQRLVVGDVMHHSRAEEFEADDLGVAFMEKAGYDGTASSDILASLAAQTALDAKVSGQTRTTPSWAMSHPDPAARVARALQRARSLGQKSGTRGADGFLWSLKGMLYGDDPQQGVIEGQVFKYPPDKLQFTAPIGYGMANGSDAVTITPTSGGTGQARFTGGAYDGNLSGVVTKAFAALSSNGSVNAPAATRTTVNGMEAMTATVGANGSSGEALDVTVIAIASSPKLAYSFAVIQPRGRGLGDLAPLVQSFRRMTDAETAKIKPRVIDVVTVGPKDTVATLSARMAYTTLQTERFLVLNGLPAGTTKVAVGRKVKLVVWGS